jgi:hypothetical protein
MPVEIDIHVTPDEITVDASGFEGTACLEELDAMTEAIEREGIKSNLSDQTRKGDQYERETVRQ